MEFLPVKGVAKAYLSFAFYAKLINIDIEIEEMELFEL